MDWQTEITELHAFFEQYMLGVEDSLDRVEQVFAPDFTYVSPNGDQYDRAATLEMLAQGHGHTNSLTIRVSEHQLLAEHGDLVVAGFVEHHDLAETTNARRHTVVFRNEPTAPNGGQWVRAHETWMPEATG